MWAAVPSLSEDTGLTVQSSKEIRIATALFPILSLLNHSCQPNTSLSFSLGLSLSGSSCPVYFASGVKVTVRASRDIAAGEELLHCYGKEQECLLDKNIYWRKMFIYVLYKSLCLHY